jgi:hypothetical protein
MDDLEDLGFVEETGDGTLVTVILLLIISISTTTCGRRLPIFMLTPTT